MPFSILMEMLNRPEYTEFRGEVSFVLVPDIAVLEIWGGPQA